MYDFLEPKSPWKWGQKAELARQAGISRQYLSDILSCRKHAPPELALKLEEASAKMRLGIKKEDFMYPKKTSGRFFNTPAVKKNKDLALKERLEKNALFMYDVLLISRGIASVRGRRPSRRKMSKRDLRIIGMMAQQAVQSIQFQSLTSLEEAIKQRDQLLRIAQQSKKAGINLPTISIGL
jgi:transcriptional regulator with XRE-family HTH domain